MGRATNGTAFALTALLLLSSAPAHGGAAEISTTRDRIIFAEKDALWSIPSAGGAPTLLAPLVHDASEVARIKVSASGTAMLVSVGGQHAWADLSSPTHTTTLKFLPFGGGLGTSPDISEDGNHVICGTQAGNRIAVYQLRPTLNVQILDRPAAGPVFFAGDSETVGFGDEGGLVALNNEQVLSPHRPDRSMAITPDGKRTVGGYNEGDIDVVYAFRIDGKATKRTLMEAARVVSISAGSLWACLQQEVDACAVRIAGGQYMCWRRYEGMDISSDAHNLLLSRASEKKGHDLFLGSISGTAARKPAPLVSSVERAAAFWPTPSSEPATTKDESPSVDGATTNPKAAGQ